MAIVVRYKHLSANLHHTYTIEVGEKARNRIGNGMHNIKQILFSTDSVAVDAKEILDSIEHILNRAINGMVRRAKAKSMSPKKNEVQHKRILVCNEIVHYDTTAIIRGSFTNAIKNSFD